MCNNLNPHHHHHPLACCAAHSVIGFIPFVGDAYGAAVGSYIVTRALK